MRQFGACDAVDVNLTPRPGRSNRTCNNDPSSCAGLNVARLSIVIPVLGNAADLERTLVSVLSNRPRGCEILAVTNTPYPDPYNLSGEVRFLEAGRKAGFVECANLG